MKKIIFILALCMTFFLGCITTTDDIGEHINYRCERNMVQQTIDKGKENVTKLGYEVIAVRTKMTGIDEYIVTIFFKKKNDCDNCQDCVIGSDVKKTNLKK